MRKKTPEQRKYELDLKIHRICKRLERLYAMQDEITELEERARSLRLQKEALECN